VRREQFEVSAGQVRPVVFASRVRGFASCCGTQLFMADSVDSAEIEITVASLDDPSRCRPEKVIWVDDKLPWVVIDPSLPAFPRGG
jgi:hypothetical protein